MRKKKAKQLAAAFLAVCMMGLVGCASDGTEEGADSGAQTPAASGQTDESLQGTGQSSLCGMLGSRSGFLFAGSAWYVTKDDFVGTAAQWFPDVAKAQETEEENGFSFTNVLTFADIPYVGSLSATLNETGQVDGCTLSFSFDTEDECLEAYLQVRDMMVESWGAADATPPGFSEEQPAGAQWMADDATQAELGMQEDGLLFTITLSAQQAMG
ncbi:MAG: hypothetical protein ACLUUJ_03510 [Acutalibacteraceae bacterium]